MQNKVSEIQIKFKRFLLYFLHKEKRRQIQIHNGPNKGPRNQTVVENSKAIGTYSAERVGLVLTKMGRVRGVQIN